MKVVTILELVAAAVLILVGCWVAYWSLKEQPVEVRSARERLLVAVHEAARAGFWLALGAWFLGLALIEEPQTWRWFIIVPIGMAGLRLAARTFLGMSR
jgi:putative Mn2+ efflux pump MntP